MDPQSFKNHLLFSRLSELNAVLRSQEAKDKIDLGYLHYFQTASNYIKNKLKLTIPILVLDADLNTLAQEISNVTSQIRPFLSNLNVGHLNNAVASLNSALARGKSLPLPISKADYDFTKAISDFESALSIKYETLKTENNKLKKQNASLNNEVDRIEQEIIKLSNLLSSKEKELQNLNSNFQTEFTNIKLNATNSIEIDRKTYKSDFEKDREQFRDELNDEKEQFTDTSNAIIAELQGKLLDAKKLVNVIGNTGATGNFQLIANYHKKSANIWRYVALGFMAVLSALLIYTIWDLSINDVDWLKSLTRIIAAGVLSYPATYAATESNKHRRQENYNRKIELELAAINPFIEILEEPKKQMIKEKLVEKYFGNNPNMMDANENKEVEVPLSTVEKLLKSFAGIINK